MKSVGLGLMFAVGLFAAGCKSAAPTSVAASAPALEANPQAAACNTGCETAAKECNDKCAQEADKDACAVACKAAQDKCAEDCKKM